MNEKLKEALVKIAKGAGVAVLGALSTYALQITSDVNFGDYALLVGAAMSVVANTIRKWVDYLINGEIK